MRIAAISDIHIRSNNKDEDLIRTLKDRVEELSPDVFVIAGDISHYLETIDDTLSKLHITGIPNLYVAGNHDVWFEREKGLSSLEKYARLIGNTCKKNGFIHLPDSPTVFGNIAFVGSIGWSDYSFRREELGIPEEAYETKHYKGAIWNDYYYIDWTFTDSEATDLFNKKLVYDLATLPESVEHVVYVSHHLPFRELTIYKYRLPWDFYSAYMGSVSTGRILLDDKRVKLTISGHSHIRNLVQIDGITAMTVSLGYGRPEDGNYEKLVHDAVALVEIKQGTVDIVEFVKGDICAGLPYQF